MFQFPWLSSLTYEFSQGLHGITRARLPYSGISGSTPVSGSPKLIATCYALHRPLTPRNPPQALKRLIKIYFLSYFKLYSIVKEQFAFMAKPNSVFRHFKKNQRRGDPLIQGPIAVGFITTKKNGGGERDRTDDLLRARQALSQLSYTPMSQSPDCNSKKRWWA